MNIGEAPERLNGPVYWPSQMGLIRNREETGYDRDQHSSTTPVIPRSLALGQSSREPRVPAGSPAIIP